MSGFVQLHCHTTWSLLDGAITAEALPPLAARQGYEAVALTDHDSLMGAVRFTRAAWEAGVKPIYGAELTLESEDRDAAGRRRRSRHRACARDATGYGNLCRLDLQGPPDERTGKPRINYDDLVERAEGLFVLSGCERGQVARLAASGGSTRPSMRPRDGATRSGTATASRCSIIAATVTGPARPVAGRRKGLRRARGGDERRPLRLAGRRGDPRSAARDQAHRAAVAHPVAPSEVGVLPEVPRRDAGAVRRRVRGRGRDHGIAEACDFDLDLASYHFPEIPIPGGETPTGCLARRCYEGARRRIDRVTREVEDRL